MKRDGFSASDLARFVQDYSWIPCLDFFNAPWSVEEVRAAVGSSKSEKTATVWSSCKSVLDSLDLSPRERLQLEIAHALVYVKDQRDVYRRKGVFLSRPFFLKVAGLCGQDLSDLALWTHDELLEWTASGRYVSPQEIARRKAGFALFEGRNGYVCVSGPEKEEAIRSFGIRFEKNGFNPSVKGIVGSRGLAQGVAKIVRTVSDLDKVLAGDVLVAITTHPDFVPAMHRACAIVTDEGGITSHAAIVSREFGIPCVVGTKKATAVFKDGDVLRVDAVSGLVCRVEK